MNIIKGILSCLTIICSVVGFAKLWRISKKMSQEQESNIVDEQIRKELTKETKIIIILVVLCLILHILICGISLWENIL